MNVLPVITRELRAQARQRFTFTLRMLGAGSMVAVAGFFTLVSGDAPNRGGELFCALHVALFLAIWILVPLSTADCISRERREGTLGLLFLTPLRAADIVVAKSIAHGLRAATLLVVILPILTVPFLMGGVSWQQASLSALVNLTAVLWALAAALVASAGARSSLRATAGAVVLSLGGMYFSVLAWGWMALQAFGQTPRNSLPFGASQFDLAFRAGLEVSGLSGGYPSSIQRGVWKTALLTASNMVLVSVLLLALAVVFAAWRIRRNWREEPPPLWVQKLQGTFCTPKIWLKFFKRWMRWKIERNPIGWLEHRTWTGRLVTWAWFAIVISIYTAALADRHFFPNADWQITMGWLMMVSIAASAVGSFRRERESGVLELLLVTPLSTKQIIGGRLRGLWGQFLPSMGILVGVWLYLDSIFRSNEAFGPCVYFTVTFLTVPVIGLYFSVRSRNYVGAFVQTLLVGLGLPLVLSLVMRVIESVLLYPSIGPVVGRRGMGIGFSGVGILLQLVLAAFCMARLRRRLDVRDFPVERTGN